MQKLIRIGTRKSPLALTQSTTIKEQIEKQYPGTVVELVKIVTKGDKILDVPLAKVGGKGLFVKEIEEAMLRNEIDLAVHSMKDVPSELPDPLHLAIVTKRENPHDAFIANNVASVLDLPMGAKVGTSSLRRRSQLAGLRPDLIIDDLRGNLDTRLRKLDEGQYDAIILAAAGLNRLGLSGRARSYFTAEQMLPAVAQGAVGIEMRRADKELYENLRFLDDRETALTVQAERGFLARLEGGCQVPIAAFATLNGDEITVTGLIASEDGSRMLKKELRGSAAEPASLGISLAEELLAMGGKEILAAVYGRSID